MQFKKTFAISTILASSAIASYIPGDDWEVLTPTATYKNAITDHPHDFGIAVVPLSTSSSSSNPQKRNVAPVSQIGDGQIQAPTNDPPRPTVPAVSQIGDGQIQAPPSDPPRPTVPAVSQIGDGQIQAPPSDPPRPTVPAVSQIGDGQIQAPPSDPPKPTVPAVSQIGDGQIQAPPSDPPKPTVPAVSQIGDGQIQAPPSDPPKPTVPAVSQIGDGQIQATKSTTTLKPDGQVSQISDGQPQATGAPKAGGQIDPSDPVRAVSCKTDGTLQLNLKDSVLLDEHGRIGSIVANHQFQFDGPPPQAGTIYAKGWSITPEGNLALGDKDIFFQCLSGNFYNLYDESIGGQCSEVHLQAIDLVTC